MATYLARDLPKYSQSDIAIDLAKDSVEDLAKDLTNDLASRATHERNKTISRLWGRGHPQISNDVLGFQMICFCYISVRPVELIRQVICWRRVVLLDFHRFAKILVKVLIFTRIWLDSHGYSWISMIVTDFQHHSSNKVCECVRL